MGEFQDAINQSRADLRRKGFIGLNCSHWRCRFRHLLWILRTPRLVIRDGVYDSEATKLRWAIHDRSEPKCTRS